MEITIREFKKTDIQNKVNWINNPVNNEFLHYDLPLEIEKTEIWYQNKSDNRFDGVICVNNYPVGLIGLININQKIAKAEVYIVVGEKKYRGKGIAVKALKLILNKGFYKFKLNKIYAFVESGNEASIRLFSKLGFEKEGFHKENNINKYGNYIDSYSFAILKRDYKNE